MLDVTEKLMDSPTIMELPLQASTNNSLSIC